MKQPYDTQAAHAYSIIVAELEEMFKALDQYRAAGDTFEKQKKLFALRIRETKVRRLMKQEYDRQNPPQLKLNIAS